jgi:hypothetical protein
VPVRTRGRRGSPPGTSAAFGGVDWAGIWRRGRRRSGSTPARWDARARTFGRGSDGTFSSEVLPGPDFLPVLGTLLALGRFPRLEYVSSTPARVFTSRDDALETLAWTVRGCTAAERRRLARWLDGTLVTSPNGVELPGRRTVRWAVLCWDKEEDP